jgi:hypothetical protein
VYIYRLRSLKEKRELERKPGAWKETGSLKGNRELERKPGASKETGSFKGN